MSRNDLTHLASRAEHRLLRLRSRSRRDAPLIIGATGGSGTRLIAHLCMELGYDLGAYLNRSLDALAFVPFYDRWIGPWWTLPSGIPPAERARMDRDFRHAVARHRASLSDLRGRWSFRARWGWKNPRSLFLLPYLDTRYPRLRFLHIVRDGRDMAFSRNQGQLHKDGAYVLDAGEHSMPEPHRSILLWNRVNLAAARYGDSCMENRYLCLRFEDLCSRPEPTILHLMHFLDPTKANPAGLLQAVHPPASLGRWRDHPSALTDELARVAREGLVRFGYLPDSSGAPTRLSDA